MNEFTKKFYPVIGVGAVVLDGDEVLLIKRGNEPCKGCWAVPGGHVEYGESIGEAAKRELLEETNVLAKPVGIIYVDEILPSTRCKHHFVLIDVLMETRNTGDLKASSDAEDAGFFNLYAPPSNTTPSTRRLIRYLLFLLGNNILYDRLIPLGGMINNDNTA